MSDVSSQLRELDRARAKVALSLTGAMVVLYFMHLRFDSPVFMRLFVTGLVLAVTVYFIMFAAFQFGT